MLNGAPLTTSFVSTDDLKAIIPPEAIPTAGTYIVTLKWSPTGKPVAPSTTPVERNPEREPPGQGRGASRRVRRRTVPRIPSG